MSDIFSGFKPAALDFLKELSENNTKEWFATRKPEYEKLIKQPSLALIAVMNERFEDLGVPYVSTPKTSMFRIHRDTRFSKNKAPYKTNIGLFFPFVLHKSDNRPVESPGLYVHIEPNELFIAGGLYMPMPEQLREIRERISVQWRELAAIIQHPIFLNEFPDGLQGERLQRVPRGYPSDHPAADFLRMKQYLVSRKLTQGEIFTEQIIDTIEAKSLALVPLLEYCTESLSL
jgi:uncharacterized protein (TIGR02453 family)